MKPVITGTERFMLLSDANVYLSHKDETCDSHLAPLGYRKPRMKRSLKERRRRWLILEEA